MIIISPRAKRGEGTEVESKIAVRDNEFGGCNAFGGSRKYISGAGPVGHGVCNKYEEMSSWNLQRQCFKC